MAEERKFEAKGLPSQVNDSRRQDRVRSGISMGLTLERERKGAVSGYDLLALFETCTRT